MIDVEQLGLDLGDGIGLLMRRFYPLLLEHAYGDAETLLELDLAFDLENEHVQRVLAELAAMVAGVTETTRQEIRDLVGKQAAEGWSIAELAAAIRAHGEIASASRAKNIAHTESVSAYSRGSLLAYQASGVVAEVEWLATLDDTTAEICRSLNGKRIKLGDEFAPGIAHPPGHPGGCRCALLPVVTSE